MDFKASAHAAPAAPVPQPRSTIELERGLGRAQRPDDLGHSNEMKRCVVEREGGTFSRRVERSVDVLTGVSFATLHIRGRQRAQRACNLLHAQVGAIPALGREHPLAQFRSVVVRHGLWAAMARNATQPA